MADQSDVELALANLIGSAIYGATNPVTAVPVAGLPVEVYRGWPGSVKLDAQLCAPTPAAIISVFTRNESERNVSRFPMEWNEATDLNAAPAFAVAFANTQVTFSGACAPLPLNVAVAQPGALYTYAVQAGDTLTSVAEAFAAAIPGASSAGAVLNCPQLVKLAVVGGAGLAVQEVRRQIKRFVVTIWSPSPDARDALAKAIDPALATNIRLLMPDDTVALMRYAWSRSDDGLQRANCYRRDFAYDIEYATTNKQSFFDVIALYRNTDTAPVQVTTYVSNGQNYITMEGGGSFLVMEDGVSYLLKEAS